MKITPELQRRHAELQAHFTKPRLLSERTCWCGQSGDCKHTPVRAEFVPSVPPEMENDRFVAVVNYYNSNDEYLGRWALTQQNVDEKFQDYLLSRVWR